MKLKLGKYKLEIVSLSNKLVIIVKDSTFKSKLTKAEKLSFEKGESSITFLKKVDEKDLKVERSPVVEVQKKIKIENYILSMKKTEDGELKIKCLFEDKKYNKVFFSSKEILNEIGFTIAYLKEPR